MKIEAGFTIAYECPAPTPMLLVLNLHPSRCGDLVSEQVLTLNRDCDTWDYIDTFGNSCTRLVAPGGQTSISTRFVISDTGLPDAVANDAVQHPIQDLQNEALVFLLGSRYCDTDRLSDFAWKQFSSSPPGWGRVQAICDFVHGQIAFDYQKADPLRTAHGGYTERVGVCRDFAHLAITLCRA